SVLSGTASGLKRGLVLGHQNVQAVHLVSTQPGLLLHDLEQARSLISLAALNQPRHLLIEKRQLISNLAGRPTDTRKRLDASLSPVIELLGGRTIERAVQRGTKTVHIAGQVRPVPHLEQPVQRVTRLI